MNFKIPLIITCSHCKVEYNWYVVPLDQKVVCHNLPPSWTYETYRDVFMLNFAGGPPSLSSIEYVFCNKQCKERFKTSIKLSNLLK